MSFRSVPRTQAEEWLAKVFGEILGISHVAPDADFFDLGGDSVRAVRVISRIRARSTAEIPLAMLFEHRTPTALADRLDLDLLDLEDADAPVIEPAPGRLGEPSHAQERLWLLDQLTGELAVHNEPMVFRLRGEVDPEALRTALHRLIDRHEVLRTSFVLDGDRPVSRVEPTPTAQLAVVELPEEAALERIRAELSTAFDLGAAPLLRTLLLRVGSRESLLVLNLHHIVTDGWSAGIVLRELGEAYRAALAGQPSPGEPLDLQYADFAAWQRAWLAAGEGERQLDYWASNLAGAPELSALRPDRLRPAVQTYRGDHVRFALPAELGAEVAAASRRHGSLPGTWLLAVYLLALHKHTGQRDLVVGTQVAGRCRPETERMVGVFVNTLPVRSGYLERDDFAGYLAELGRTWLGALDHQDVPFEQIVQRLNLAGVSSHSPLVQTLFAYREAVEPLRLPGLETEAVEVTGETARFDLSLSVRRSADGSLGCDLEYSTDLYDRSTVERFAGHFRTLLEQVLQAPRRQLARYRLSTPEELAQLAAWNATGTDFPADRCLHELVEDQVRATPDAPALVMGDTELDYAELDARANRLAHHLVRLGVRPDDVVGVCLDRSPELIVALLATLKAGAAYLPLDPQTPRQRLDQIMTDARSRVCLTLGRQTDRAPEVAHLVVVDDTAAAFAELPRTKPAVAVRPANLVSVYYTSGSTGAPKGVASTHAGWVNRMVWMQKQHALRPGETVLHKTTLTFDDSALELFWPLMYGGRIALMEPGLHRDPEAILAAATKYRTVLLQTVPSMLTLLMDTVTEADRAALGALRNTVSSGEALTPAAVRRFHEVMPGALHNTWGATEVSIDSTIRTCTPEDGEDTGAVSVGVPFDNNTVYVLDPAFNPVPPGVVGDLFIGGLGLARGYLNDPVKTAQAFLASPFVPGERLYRTGDQGYLRADGSIKFMGRNDHQIKIRGMRVELGEIESVLRDHSRVQDAAVVARRTSGGHYRLTGCVTPRRSDDAPTVGELRQHLAEWLPEHMRPPFLMVLERMPLNANGKIDRHRLPDPAQGQEAAERERAPLEGPVEQAVAAIWANVLEVETVGADDNFFDLGGHSLIATRVVVQLRDGLGVDLPLQTVFTQPVLRSFAAEVESTLMARISRMSPEHMRALLDTLG
ncbi:amino acid adenylation domain-containing protein [Streptomyces sp. cf386]|uniref:non-ribosomal peptide synthetase n=1 Tax=Streptomyces sp. cf386 TaxID=1761904 RepID=UPI0008859408|nr:non-ribosomal peptide synthetase [Streptomyces sp. cf386]SDN74223.1 amino acid adenylation domain-containing protein [Streptomyces sp. cf386]